LVSSSIISMVTSALKYVIHQVDCGLAAGGGEFEINNQEGREKHLFAGGSGAGVSVKPVGFLVVRMNDVRLISVPGKPLAERVVDVAPQIFDKSQALVDRRERNHPSTLEQ